MFRLFGVFFLLSSACGDSEEKTYNLFNSDSDFFEVEIGLAEETDDLSLDLHSSTGQVIVGSANLSPAGGPVGTTHRLVVEVANEWEEDVSRVVLNIDSGERGQKEYILDRDSADAGYHQIDVQSVGDEGETRTDVFTIQLFVENGVQMTNSDTGNN
jgi:hypothetical protein